MKVYWIAGQWKGRLAIVSRPRGADWLADDTAAWRAAGIDVVVSLLQPHEARHLELEDEATVAAASGVDFLAFSIPDEGVPASRESAAGLIDDIIGALMRGRTVAIHCRQSIGRSGLIASGVLVAAGADPVSAIEIVSAARGLDVPETDEQRQWLGTFAAWIAAAKEEPRAARWPA